MKRLATAAVAGAVMFGLRDTLEAPRARVPIVVEYAGEPPELTPVTLFFHPQVPEATLVLVQ